MPEGPQRTRLDWKNLGKYAPGRPAQDADAGGSGDAETLGPVSSRCGYLRSRLPVDTVARIVELRGEGLSFKKIGKALGIAAWTVSREERGR